MFLSSSISSSSMWRRPAVSMMTRSANSRFACSTASRAMRTALWSARESCTGALKPHQHEDLRRRAFQVQVGVLAAQKPRQLLVDDLDELLIRGEALEHLLAQRLGFERVEEALDDLEVDVGFEQRHAHVPKRVVDVVFADFPLAAEFLESQLQLVSEVLEHVQGFRLSGITLRRSLKD